MSRRVSNQGDGRREVARRDVLKPGVAAGLGLGVAALPAVRPPPTAATPVYGGHATVLSYAFPEAWDPHRGGNLAVTAVVSPLYNQVGELNPLNSTESIGDLATRWEVTDNDSTYIFHLHEPVQWWDGKDLTAEDVAFGWWREVSARGALPTGFLVWKPQ